MQELIPLQPQTINGNAVETVSARELHEFLGVTERFSSWMERQFQYGFEENVDYLGCKVFNTLAKQEVQEYYLSLDCAKEISMIQKSDKGKQARKYFIECEKKLREVVQPQPARIIGATEDKLNTIILALQHTSLSDIAKETYIITSAETLTGVYLGYRPQVEQVTYSAKEVGDMLGISANRVGRIANAHGLKTKEYGLYYLNKSQHSDKQVEHFRYFEKAIDKFKSILENE